MHWNECFCLQLKKCFDGLLGVHVDIAFRRCVIRPDWQKCDLDRQALTDLAEPLKVSAVTTMENRTAGILEVEPPESSVTVM